MASGLLVHLTLASYKVARTFNRSGATQTTARYIPNTFDRVWHDGIFNKPKSSQVIWNLMYLAVFHHFSVINSSIWFWMGSICKDIQLILVFLNTLYLLLCFFYYTLMIFPIMLSMTLISSPNLTRL